MVIYTVTDLYALRDPFGRELWLPGVRNRVESTQVILTWLIYSDIILASLNIGQARPEREENGFHIFKSLYIWYQASENLKKTSFSVLSPIIHIYPGRGLLQEAPRMWWLYMELLKRTLGKVKGRFPSNFKWIGNKNFGMGHLNRAGIEWIVSSFVSALKASMRSTGRLKWWRSDKKNSTL